MCDRPHIHTIVDGTGLPKIHLSSPEHLVFDHDLPSTFRCQSTVHCVAVALHESQRSLLGAMRTCETRLAPDIKGLGRCKTDRLERLTPSTGRYVRVRSVISAKFA